MAVVAKRAGILDSPRMRGLIRRLDDAVANPDAKMLCESVKDALVEAVGSGERFLPERFTRPSGDKYARRLLHKDARGRYSVVAMVWGAGQGTPLHDHAGRWCVECVYDGRIRVDSYELLNPEGGGPYRFKHVGELIAGISAAGALIPPFEHHSIHNADETPSVTIHVYCEELNVYNAFVPVDGGYARERRESYYTE